MQHGEGQLAPTDSKLAAIREQQREVALLVDNLIGELRTMHEHLLGVYSDKQPQETAKVNEPQQPFLVELLHNEKENVEQLCLAQRILTSLRGGV